MHAPPPLRMAVIGLGVMGSRHARVIAQSPLAELVAVSDIDAQRLVSLSEELGADAYPDYRDLLRSGDAEAVSICTPDDGHVDPCLAAAGAGMHVLVEKPLATTVAGAEAVIAACREAKVKLMAAHLLRFDPRYQALKRAIERGRLGTVGHIGTHRNSPWTEGPARYPRGTSLTLHVAVHDLDLVNWYLGARPVTVYARGVRRKLADRDMDDAVSAIIAFDSGAVASLHYSWALPPASVTRLDARLELLGSDGMALVGSHHGQGVFIASGEDWDAPDVHHGFESLDGRLIGDVREEIHAFIDAVRYDRTPPVSGEDALLVVREAITIERSLRTGEVVDFDL